MSRPRPGRLRHRVIVEKAAETEDGAGGFSTVWTTFVTRWASIEPMSTREILRHQQVESPATHKVTMRYDASNIITTKHRLKFNDRLFNIRGIKNIDERNRYIELTVEEKSGT